MSDDALGGGPQEQASARRVVGRRVLGRTEERSEDRVAVEEPLEIRIGDLPVAVTMRTPGHDRDLAAGFCLTEGIVRTGDDIESVEPCGASTEDNVVVVRLEEQVRGARARELERARRDLFLSSSCGICGKQSIDRVRQRLPEGVGTDVVDLDLLAELPERMGERQTVFRETGGLHAAALFDPGGRLLVLREDVGRHNAVDKVIGQRLLVPDPRTAEILLVSGRVSFEVVQKAAMARVPVVAAVSAPTSLAIDLAREAGITLVGFLRGDRMNVYHRS